MPDLPQLPTTQRAYTLRLRAAPAADDETNKERRKVVADALWATHEAVNAGAKVFGDWLLTLRGGLDHKLMQLPDVTDAEIDEEFNKEKAKAAKANKKQPDREAIAKRLNAKRVAANSDAMIRDRRILLCLSWLSVEDQDGAPTDGQNPDQRLRIATNADSDQCAVIDDRGCAACRPGKAGGAEYVIECRGRKLLNELCQILKSRGVPDDEIGDPDKDAELQSKTWVGACAASLAARVRDDAVWINRSKVFDGITLALSQENKTKARRGAKRVLSERVWRRYVAWLQTKARYGAKRVLWHLLDKEDYLRLPKSSTESSANDLAAAEEDGSEATAGEESTPGTAVSGEGGGQRSRRLYGHVFEGTGGVESKTAAELECRQLWEKDLRQRFKDIRPLVSDVEAKKRKGRAKDGYSPTNLHRQMLAKATSRLAQIWTKLRQQEKDRQARKAADESLKILESSLEYRESIDALDAYCKAYRVESGAAGEFRIRPRQLLGWDRVVKKWASIREADEKLAREKRIEAVKLLQDEDVDKKFRDVNLFFRLAEETYRKVWWHDDKPNATILDTYVRGMKARSDALRLKVAAYRHPCAYTSPVYCDFDNGNNCPEIAFRRLRPLSDPKIDDLRAIEMDLWHGDSAKLPSEVSKWVRVTPLYAVSCRFDREIGSACDNIKIGGPSLRVVSRRGRLGASAAGICSAKIPAKVGRVFDDQQIRKKESDDESAPDRLKPAKWSAKLTTDRSQLRAILKLLQKAEDPSVDAKEREKYRDRAETRRRQLRWSLAVALELEKRGPWFRYVEATPGQTPHPFQRRVKKDEEKGQRRKKGTRYLSLTGWPWEEINKPLKDNSNGTELVVDEAASRGSYSSLILARLPGLRLLSVDLGLRYAATCTAWEAISLAIFKSEIVGRNTIAGGTGTTDLYLHTTHTDDKGKHHTSVYRRIGEDCLRDPKTGKLTDTPHPAPWAKLERQFVIKLQGEEKSAREASNREVALVHDMEYEMGFAVPLIYRLIRAGWGATEKQRQRLKELKQLVRHPLTQNETGEKTEASRRAPSLQVDDLMSSLVDNVRASLRRHTDRARMAFGFVTKYKPMPGEKELYFDPAMGSDKFDKTAKQRIDEHTDYLQDLLMLWHDLATAVKWRDKDALDWWNDEEDGILAWIRRATCPEPELSDADKGDSKKCKQREEKKAQWQKTWDNTLMKPLTRPSNDDDQPDVLQRKAQRETLKELLRPVAESLRTNLEKRQQITERWKQLWWHDEGQRRTKDDFHHGVTTTPKVLASGWHERLAQVRNWLMPRGDRYVPENETKQQKQNRRKRRIAAMHVGGLSLKRIDTLVECRRALVQFRTSLTPLGRCEVELRDGSLAAKVDCDGRPVPREAKEKYAQKLLDVIDRLREQRSKQLASRIVEAALGVGSENAEHWTLNEKRVEKIQRAIDRQRAKGKKHPLDGGKFASRKTLRPEAPIDNKTFAPCHAVVIERLDDYKPDQIRSKRENRMLAAWRKADFKKRLKEACELHGLLWRDVMAKYTSRQDSRTGLPGLRCDDMPVEEFIRPCRAVKQAVKKLTKDASELSSDATWEHRLTRAIVLAESDAGTEEDRFLVQLFSKWDATTKTWTEKLKGRSGVIEIHWKLRGNSQWTVPDEERAQLDASKKFKAPRAVRLLRDGGDLFVAAVSRHKSSNAPTKATGTQADINAAANVGLRALLDPDFPGKWWYIPAALDDEGWRWPDPKSCANAACLTGWRVAQATSKRGNAGFSINGRPPSDDELKAVTESRDALKVECDAIETAKNQATQRDERKQQNSQLKSKNVELKQAEATLKQLTKKKLASEQKVVVNLWHDPNASCPSSDPKHGSWWREHSAYWNDVRCRVIAALRQYHNMNPDTPEIGNDEDETASP